MGRRTGGIERMQKLQVPSEIQAALREYYTCEATTVNRQGQPVTWPCLPYFHEKTGEIVFTASIAFPVKALNARRHPQVSLLYSDPCGTRTEQLPTLLVQGAARVVEMLDYKDPLVVGLFRAMKRRQPDSERFFANRLMRRLFSWYLFQRLMVIITPRRILAWPSGDFQVAPTEIEVAYVE